MAASHLKATALATAFLLLVIQANAYTMEDMCAQWSGNGYIGNPADCTGWGYCKSQELAAWGNCPTGQVYDAQLGSCQYATDTPCSTSVSQTCKVLTTAAFVADPNDCTKYAYCFGNGKSETVSCPKGQNYAANNNSCVWGPSCPQSTICRFMPNNIYVGDPTHCGQYLQCINGAGIWGQCPSPYTYNAALGICSQTNPCTGNDNNDGGSSSPIPPTGVTPPTKCTGLTEFTSDGFTCYGYYYCKNTDATPVWSSCPPGTEFDKVKSFCVSPMSLNCAFDRCANTNMTYAAQPGCKTYSYCPNGATGQCPTDFPYFDEVAQTCVSTWPNYEICKPEPTG